MPHEHDYLPAAGRDAFLPFYDFITAALGTSRAREALLAQATVTPGQQILDIGCGTGTFALQLLHQIPAADFTGIDPDPKALARARHKAAKARLSPRFDQGYADKLPYDAASFDHVFSSLMFHHLHNEGKQAALAEVRRVLKPGGAFHLMDFTGQILHGHTESEANLLDRMKSAGLANPRVVAHRKMLLGLATISYFESSAP
jgi:ubiquinone/menaquinone biosynthesis C-methylase UbiE